MIKSIPVSKIDDFQKIIRDLNKKQAQYGMAPTSAKEIGRHAEEIPFVTHEAGDRPEQDTVRVVKVLFVDYEMTNLGIVRNNEGYEYVGTRTKDKSGVVIYDFNTKDKVLVGLMVSDHVKVKGVFRWECKYNGRYIYQNINRAKLIEKGQA